MADRFPACSACASLALVTMLMAGCGTQGGNSANQAAGANAATANGSGSGNLAVGYTSTEYGIVRAMLNLADVGPNDLVMDLGSGDGRIPILAAKEKGARGIGVELDPRRIQESNANASREGVGTRVEFHQQDLFVTGLNDVTVLTLYLLPEINLQLRPKILAQMRPGTRVVSNSFDMGDWRPDRREKVGDTAIFLWVVPAQVAGRWQVQVDGAASGMIALDQHYQQVSGRGPAGDLADVSLRGDRIAFTADLGRGQRRYEGRVDGSSITGEGWRATKVG